MKKVEEKPEELNENSQQTKKVKILPSKKPEENLIIELSKEEKTTDFSEEINKARLGLFSLYKKTSRGSTILMFVVVVIFVAAFIMLPQQPWGPYACWSLVGATLVGLIIYFIYTKNLYPNASKNYFNLFWKETNEYLFSATEFTDCKIDIKERYVLPEVITDKVYKDIVDTASRNIVRGKYKGKGFAFGELAFYKLGAKKNQRDVIFVGRHLEMENNLHFEGRYLVNIRGEKDIDLPNDLDDLKELVSQNKFVIYGPEGANPEKDLGKDLIENLKSIECKGAFLNANFSFYAGHTAAYLSYDDSIVAIPFDKEMDIGSYQLLRKNIMDIFEILEDK